MECCPRIFQKGTLLRFICMEGRDNGIRNLPSFQIRCGGRTLDEESSGTYDRRSRLRKSKILCLAGFTPVAKVDHATGERAGNVVRRRRYEPCSFKRPKLGSLPSAIKRSVNSGS